MDDLQNLIDEYESLLTNEFLNAVSETQDGVQKYAIEEFILENYPADEDQLPPDNNLDEIILNAFETQLSQGFEEKLTALQEKSEAFTILFLGLAGIDKKFPGTGLVQSEIRQMSSGSKKAIQLAGNSKKRILETIGLTENQARSLQAYRKELERISNQTKKAKAISTRLLRNLSASQRSVLSSALTNGLKPEQVDALVGEHRKAMLTHRAKAIGTSLSTKIAHATQQAVIDFAISTNLIEPDQYKRFWRTAHDEKVRHAHNQTEAMNAAGVNLNQPFITPFGLVMFPPLEINCRCHVAIRKV